MKFCICLRCIWPWFRTAENNFNSSIVYCHFTIIASNRTVKHSIKAVRFTKAILIEHSGICNEPYLPVIKQSDHKGL